MTLFSGPANLVRLWWPVALIAIGIFTMSSFPGQVRPEPLPLPHLDKAAHFLAFGALALALHRALSGSTAMGRSRRAILVVLVVLLYGILDEVHQFFVPLRTVEILDVVSDAAGGIAATWAVGLYQRRRWRKEKNNAQEIR
jgi:VanZ family protein